MPDLARVRNRTWSLLLEPSAPQRAIVADAAPQNVVFSVFNDEHLEQALTIAAEMMRVANTLPAEAGLDAVLDYYQDARSREHPDMVDHALLIFITHHPRGRALTHAVPPITMRNPDMVAPSAAAAGGLSDAAADPAALSGGAIPPDGLEWFREDPFANEHHTHWHVVYPTRGVPDPANPNQRLYKPYHGELFFYMHAQMLARYDAERVALGLPRVAPLADYRTPVSPGYDPGPWLAAQFFAVRPERRRMADANTNPPHTVGDHEADRDRLKAAVAARAFSVGGRTFPMNKVTVLGGTIEASPGAGINTLAGPTAQAQYGNLHNTGHGMLAAASVGGNGVMATPTTAIRDPVFFQWHKHIDDVSVAWQDAAAPNTFDDRPPALVRKGLDPSGRGAVSPDIILLFEDQIPAAARDNIGAWAQETFGAGHWDTDFSATPATTPVLETRMLHRQLTLEDRVTIVPLQHLVHRPFAYVFRVENLANRQIATTLRVFLAPIDESEDRRAWIELDKFVATIDARARTAVIRTGAQSAVVRKPAVMTPELLKAATIRFSAADLDAMVSDGMPRQVAAALRPFVDRTVLVNVLFRSLPRNIGDAATPFLRNRAQIVPSEQPRPIGGDETPDELEELETFNYCSCGWPYNLLLPRGTTGGMRVRLAVICTDDALNVDQSCGSLSFCGARGDYPDPRAMGYPFDRRFRASISDTIMANPNMAFRDIFIKQTADEVVDD